MLLDKAEKYNFTPFVKVDDKKRVRREVKINCNTANNDKKLLLILQNESIINFNYSVLYEIMNNCLFDALNDLTDVEAIEFLEQEAIRVLQSQRTLNKL